MNSNENIQNESSNLHQNSPSELNNPIDPNHNTSKLVEATELNPINPNQINKTEVISQKEEKKYQSSKAPFKSLLIDKTQIDEDSNNLINNNLFSNFPSNPFSKKKNSKPNNSINNLKINTSGINPLISWLLLITLYL